MATEPAATARAMRAAEMISFAGFVVFFMYLSSRVSGAASTGIDHYIRFFSEFP
jgi:hypothetical protein